MHYSSVTCYKIQHHQSSSLAISTHRLLSVCKGGDCTHPAPYYTFVITLGDHVHPNPSLFFSVAVRPSNTKNWLLLYKLQHSSILTPYPICLPSSPLQKSSNKMPEATNSSCSTSGLAWISSCSDPRHSRLRAERSVNWGHLITSFPHNSRPPAT